MPDFEVLAGGVNQVVRIGDRVRRPTGFWSPRVHDLLRHLEKQGFTGAPRLFGTSDDVEELEFLPGEVPSYPPAPTAASLEALVSAATLLRAYHDAVADYAQHAPRDGWQLPALEPIEVILHSDFAPHNGVLAGSQVVGMIDFDYARPGPRLWDVAFAAYRWVPLSGPDNADGFGTTDSQATRLRQFCDAYGLLADERRALIGTVLARVQELVDYMHAEAAAGNAAFAGHVDHGHDQLYLGDLAYIAEVRAVFEQALGSSTDAAEGSSD